MNNASKIVIALVAVAVITVGAVALGNKSNNNDTNDKTNTPSTSNNSNSSELADDQIAATITYTSDGFSPASVTVASGSAVRIINKSDVAVAPSSNDHPAHTDNPELNFPNIEPGQSADMVVTKKGTWGMHNHFNDDERLTVVVE